jgi:hypothetical protein
MTLLGENEGDTRRERGGLKGVWASVGRTQMKGGARNPWKAAYQYVFGD